ELSKRFDKVIVLPNYLNPLKNSFSAPPQKRIEWIKKSINQKNVEISDYEIKQNKPCYTIDTIKHFLKKYDKISFVIGADNLSTLNKWKNIEELKKLINFIVVSRDYKKSDEFETINLDIKISSTEIRKNPENYKNYLPAKIADEIINFYKG
ncbi:MAG: nicotinate (nicotinamide) nucleotide adenylyltransferase, partial [Nautilia sp.]